MTTMTLAFVRRVACATGVVLATHALGAQAGPPLAKVVGDSQIPLKKPAAVSAPPSTVAPSVRRRTPTKADSATVEPMKRSSAPVDSVRPAAPARQQLDSSRAPRTAVPPRPATRDVAPLQTSASIQADGPPPGATARCKDGTYVSGTVDDSSCGNHGGISVRLPAAAAAPTPPRRPNP